MTSTRLVKRMLRKVFPIRVTVVAAAVLCVLAGSVVVQAGSTGTPSPSGKYRLYEGVWALEVLRKCGYLKVENGYFKAEAPLTDFLSSKHSETSPRPCGLVGFIADWNGDVSQPLPKNTVILVTDRGHVWQSFPNMCIPGHNIKHITSLSVADCKKECRLDPGCKSVDYKPTTSECWLQDVDQTSGLLERCNSEFDHYSLGF